MPRRRPKKRIPKDDINHFIYQLHDYNINIKSREIYLHSRCDFDEEQGVEFVMATHFIKNLNFLSTQNKENILVRMHTLGGNWQDGIAIYDAIKLVEAPVTILAYAWARSMSSIIFQAADNRVLMPDTDFMVHFGTMADENSYLNFMSGAEFSKKATDRMLQIYAKRCINGTHFVTRYKSLTEDKVMSFIDRKMKEKGDWWMTADEAVYYGFSDGIFGEPGFETVEKIRVNKKNP